MAVSVAMNRIVRGSAQPATISAGAISVDGGEFFSLAPGTPTTLSTINDGAPGQSVALLFLDGNTTVDDAGNIVLTGISFSPITGSVLTLVYDGTNWHEPAVTIPTATGEGIINVLDYGAVGDGVTDDTTAIQAAVAAGAWNYRVYFPGNKTYLISDQITCEARSLFGEHMWRHDQKGSLIKAHSSFPAGKAMFKASSNSFQIFNLGILCEEFAEYGVWCDTVFNTITRIENVSVKGAKLAGFWFDGCHGIQVDRCTAVQGLDLGFKITDGNAGTYTGCTADNNGGSGVLVEIVTDSGGCRIKDWLIQNNAGHGIEVRGISETNGGRITRFVAIDNWLEGNNLDGIVMEFASNATLERNYTAGGGGDTSKRAYRLIDTLNCLVRNNTAPYGTNVPYAAIREESCVSNRIVDNWVMSQAVADVLPTETV